MSDNVIRPSEFGKPIPRDLAPSVGRPRTQAEERRRMLREMIERNELVMAEIKSQQQVLLAMLDNTLGPKGAA